ncbi:MAG: hypothetical protein RSA17_04620 [Ruthenibacterium sp.]
MKQKRNSKKGISLVELVCAMVVLTLAVTFGLQLYFVGTKATMNSARLDTATELIVHEFETGDSTKLWDMPGWTQPRPQDNTITVNIGGVSLTDTSPVMTETVEEGTLKTQLTIRKESIGGKS